jgi:hypothetical protein
VHARRTLLAVTALLGLVVVSNAAGVEVDGHTATAAPAYVEPSTQTTFTIRLTNKPASPAEADRARIGIPAGFVVDAASVQASTVAAGGCVASTWVADGTLIAGGSINLRRPGGGPDNRLCPGGTLTVTFSSTTPGADGTHVWATELLRGGDTFVLTGPPPSVTVDGTAPTVTITSHPPDPANGRAATFEFSASESATFQCRLDEAAFAACEPPRTYANLSEGRHTFVVRAVDTLGNVGAEAAHAWTIDTRLPAVAVSSSPPALSNRPIAAFSFSSDEPSTFECSLDDRGFEPCSSPASYAGLRDGAHAFVVRATDAAGNVTAVSRAWTIDTMAPQTTIESAPRATTAAGAVSFRFSASERATFQCRLDRAAFSPCTSPAAYSRLARGRHRFSVRAVDSAGNVDATPATFQWTVATVRRVAAASALLAPTAGARVSAPPLLRWRSVPRATYYNLQLYRGGRKVLSAWPTRPRLQLRMRWRFNGRAEHLSPGAYRWYVWPGFGNPAAPRYGRLLGTSTFAVTRVTRRR